MITKVEDRSLFSLLKIIWKNLSKKRKFQVKFLTIIVFFSSFSEIISISSLIPYLAVLINPNTLFENNLIKNIAYFFRIQSAENLILPLTIVFVISTLLSGFLRIIFNFYTLRISSKIGSDLSIKAYSFTLNRPYKYHLKQNSNKLITTIAKEINEVIYYVINPIFQLISALIISISILLTLSFINFTVTLTSLIILSLLYFLFVRLTAIKIMDLSKRNLELSRSLIKLIQESIGGIREIILSSNQKFYN